jgi:hypothetical protein
MNEAMMLCDC